MKLYKKHKMVVLPLLFKIHQKPVTVFALFKSAACVREGVKKTGKIGQADPLGMGVGGSQLLVACLKLERVLENQ